jgi:predicted transcriptional regulator
MAKTVSIIFTSEPSLLGKNRDRLSLIAAILQASNGGATKTRIMLNANLSFKLLEKYLYTSIRLGFIQQIESHYTLTVKGREFFNEYKNLNQEHSAAIIELANLKHKRIQLERQCQENPPSIIQTKLKQTQ